ncbi:inactive all-trans-retinol 13,14-reductase isoform X4 [Neoarius graeffei]|uniref:inactive all-trans-retinol 13,14-reductase isoform X4 n=1 Tax=Neoarius graeffei TaxID=443677 RepID=UPI00298CE8E3|nr:inactive all-trans-retinol 13,14-reductase isoform X4 [Neoarius graeffei]
MYYQQFTTANIEERQQRKFLLSARLPSCHYIVVHLDVVTVNKQGKVYHFIGSRRRRWIAAINRKDWQPLAYQRLCSDHFVGGFRKEKVPENLDAIVIGSGIGGMTVAATLAKLGKRVLVLEQHDKAGGCCHTFTEKGFEFEAGVPPKESSCIVNAVMLHHYKRGAYYPKGGSSEIPFHITKVIQKFGGRVLVRAPVNRILVDNKGAAYGVTVEKGQEDVEVRAPVIISNCGVFNTFQKLLPSHIQTKPEIQKRLNMMRPGRGCLLVFSGFDATEEELGISSTTIWLFKSNDMDAMWDEYFSMGKDEAPDNIPMMYFTFPSAKDPTSKIRHPGKSYMIILTMVSYEWFEEWKDTPVGKRGDDYLTYKRRFGNNVFDWACSQYPKLRDKLVFQEVSTPLSNTHYLGSYLGAMYSAEQNLERFQAEAIARNRCDTPVKNLFISGQDVFSCGIAGALHGGLLCASTVLRHIVYIDLFMLKKKLKRNKARGTAKHIKLL